jgi:hypothetical protein
MTILRVTLATALFLFAAKSTAQAQAGDPFCETPVMRTVSPETGQAGTLHVVTGDCLNSTLVRQVFLTLGQTDIALEVIAQSDITIHFRIPRGTRAGRYTLMVLTGGKTPKLIEQPVKLMVTETLSAR